MSGEAFGANTYAIDVALSLARYRGDQNQIAELEQRRAVMRALCESQGHGLNPPGHPRCVWCGAELRPGIVKIEVKPYRLPGMRRSA